MKHLVFLSVCLFVSVFVFSSKPVQAESREVILKKNAMNIAHREMLAAEDFANLDKAMNRIQREYEEGKWTDKELRSFFVDPFRGADSGFEDIYNKWVKAYPRSYAARQVRGSYFYYMMRKHYFDALKISASGKIEQIPQEQAEKIKHYADLAIRDNAAALGLDVKKPILAYSQLVGVYRVFGSHEKSRKMLDEANKIAPRNIIARSSYMGFLDTGVYTLMATLDEMQKVMEELRKNNLSAEEDSHEIINSFHSRLLRDSQYELLDREMNRIQKDYESGKIDDVALSRFFNIFRDTNPVHAEKYNAWVAAYPQSYAARQARAMYFRGVAWDARGTASMRDTSTEEREGMQLYMKRSMDDSMLAATLTAKPVLTYDNILVLSQLGGSRATINQMITMANMADPKNSLVRRSYMHSLQTRWGGSLAEMEEFLKASKAAGLPDRVIMDFEDAIVTEKLWIADNIMDTYSNIGQLVTGF
ncbi:MAG: DUF4034 domain-containing protein [Micavibrio sp.]|nr:MAG: DUF4034 domain-containing protein [Micavibrio sp.]